MHLSISTPFKDDNRLSITDNDSGIRDTLFKELLGFQPTMGWMLSQKGKVTLFVDDRYFHGAHERLNGRTLKTPKYGDIEVTVVNVKEKVHRVLEVLIHISSELKTYTVTIPGNLVCGQIKEIFDELGNWQIKHLNITIDGVSDDALTKQALKLLKEKNKPTDEATLTNKLYVTDNASGMRDDHFLYILGYQPDFGAMLINKGSVKIILPEQEKGRTFDMLFIAKRLGISGEFYIEVEYADDLKGCIKRAFTGMEEKSVSLSPLLTFNQLTSIVEAKKTNTLHLDRSDFEDARKIKKADEIEYHKTAIEIIEKVFAHIEELNDKGELKGKKEKEVVKIVQDKIVEFGGEREAFPTIVSYGKNAAVPHHIPTQTVPGDDVISDGPLLFDIGAVFGGRCSDFTRTLWVGDVTDANKKLHEYYLRVEDIVEKIHNYSLSIAKLGVSVGELDNKSKAFAKAELAKEPSFWQAMLLDLGFDNKVSIEDFVFSHGLGHGVGIRIHEFPYFTLHKDAVLEKGMFITIEPGIYIPGHFGVRLENLYYVGDEGTLVTDNKMPLKSTNR